jgi:hypothetical protein
MVFEQHTFAERYHVLGLAWWLLREWPLRLEAAWKDKAVRYNVLEKDFYDALGCSGAVCWSGVALFLI